MAQAAVENQPTGANFRRYFIPPAPQRKTPADLSAGAVSQVSSLGLAAAFVVAGNVVEDIATNNIVGCRLWRGQTCCGFGFFATGLDDNVVTICRNLAHLLRRTTGTGWDQTAHDDVLFQANQLVALTLDRCFGQNACGFLEGRRRDEAAGLQRRLGDPQQDRFALRRTSAFGQRFGTGLVELLLVDVFAFQQGGITAVLDFPLLQHLTHDHFDMLIVDLNALQTINILHFVDHVVSQRFDPHNREDVMRRRVAVHDVVALLDKVTFRNGNVLTLRHHVFDLVQPGSVPPTSSHLSYAGETLAILEEGGNSHKDVGVVGLNNMPLAIYEPLSRELGSKLRRVDDIVAELRSVKSPEEIELMKHAARLADLGFETMLKVARPGLQGIEIVAEMERVMRREGADLAKFWIASGPAPDWNNLRFEVKPHHRVLEEGDLPATLEDLLVEEVQIERGCD